MRKAIIISGPTASGKTELAYRIAQNIPTVLINADSRQIYKNLDIIAGKDIPKDAVFKLDERFSQKIGYYQLTGTRIYLVDFLNPSQSFSVHSYAKVVGDILPIISEEHTPIFVGGSNFYISSLLTEIETAAIPPNPVLRKKFSGYTVNQLQNELEIVDKKKLLSMNNSDSKNPRRLMRAIEIGVSKEKEPTRITNPVLAEYEVMHVGLTAPLDYLRKKIDARVDARIAQGALEEAHKLFLKFEDLSSSVKTANGYAQLFNYLEQKISYDEALQQWKYSEYHNAKKQLTWIHGDSNIQKYSIINPHFIDLFLHDALTFIAS